LFNSINTAKCETPMALKQKINNLDSKTKKLMEKYRNPFLSEFFDSVTSLGSPPLVILIIGVLWSAGETSVAKPLILGLLIGGIIVRIGKITTDRTRPENHIGEFYSQKSFPSGHSTSAFMTATILNHFYNRPAAFFGLATTVAISRIYLEDHYLTDIIAGTLIGLTVGLAII